MTKHRMIVVSGPSGSGKGTIISMLPDNYRKSVSATTRATREGEIEGVDYFFITKEEFFAMRERDEFTEWNQYGNDFYGTPKAQIDELDAAGLTAVLDIDVNGARNIKRLYPETPVIYLLLPSANEQVRRLVGRAQNTHEQIIRRLRTTKDELDAIDMFDCVLLNEYGMQQRTAHRLLKFLNQGLSEEESVGADTVNDIVKHYFDNCPEADEALGNM